MNPRARCLASAPLALMLSLGRLHAQQAPATPNPPAAAPSNATGGITINVVASAKSGQGEPISDLRAQDFTILSNGVPQPITHFRALGGAKAPVEVILVIDNVNTNHESVVYERAGIDAFLRANGGHLAHPTTLAILNVGGVQMQPGFTFDGAGLARAFDQATLAIRSMNNRSSERDRSTLSRQAMRQLIQRESLRPYTRKVMVWVSPGWPLLSDPRVVLDYHEEELVFHEAVEFSTMLRQARITVYSVNPLAANEDLQTVSYYRQYLKGVSKLAQVEAGDLGLQVLAVQSGGLVVNSGNDLSAMLEQVNRDLDAYYEISFDPPPAEHPDEYRSIEVKVDRPGVAARTRQGFYMQPPGK